MLQECSLHKTFTVLFLTAYREMTDTCNHFYLLQLTEQLWYVPTGTVHCTIHCTPVISTSGYWSLYSVGAYQLDDYYFISNINQNANFSMGYNLFFNVFYHLSMVKVNVKSILTCKHYTDSIESLKRSLTG